VRIRVAVVLAAASLGLSGQEPVKQETVHVIGSGVIPPIPIHRVEPEYPELARKERVQGAVLLEMVVGSDGVPSRIEVHLPAGHGFDERAIQSVSQWRFTPGMKDGKPVAIRAGVEVTFALPGARLDKKEADQRTTYTKALNQLMGTDKKLQLKALESMVKLSKKKFAPAMMVEGTYLMSGELGPRDPEGGRALVSKSAELGFAPAIYLRGWMMVEAVGVEKDITFRTGRGCGWR
jgi:TonB family protein